MRDIAQQLGIPVSAVRRITTQLGLAFSDSRHRPARLKREDQPTHSVNIQEDDERKTRRLTWLKAVQENPGAGINALRERVPQVYRWLYYHDKEWLRENSPKRKGGKPIFTPRVDWTSEDAQLAQAVRSAAHRLRNAVGKPVWITASSIGKAIGKPRRLYLDLERLPLTAAALTEVVETREQWAVRRIRWTADLYLQEGLCPGRIAFIRRAGMRNSAERPRSRRRLMPPC